MFKNLGFIILIVCTSTLLAGCGNKLELSKSDQRNGTTLDSIGSYEMIDKALSKSNVVIHYPQITGLGNANKQDIINRLIQDDAYGYMGKYSEEETSNWSADIDYKTTFKNNKYLSIQYTGYSYDKGLLIP
ncbi:DUF4163 domain-containing protein [Paenibacillus algorifonticola]|uniref:PdaC/SigV domain-containing protein n=1 Tax=Paenibacillus algorifonticola TaxID=684063 RepID=UPI003D29E6C3